MYKLLITKAEPKTAEQIKEIEQARKYGHEYPFSDNYQEGINREQFNISKELLVTLTDEEFAAVKKSVLEIM